MRSQLRLHEVDGSRRERASKLDNAVRRMKMAPRSRSRSSRPEVFDEALFQFELCQNLEKHREEWRCPLGACREQEFRTSADHPRESPSEFDQQTEHLCY